MCDFTKCEACGKACGELRELPGKQSEEIKKDTISIRIRRHLLAVCTFDNEKTIPVFVKQSGVRQWDADGNEYIDTYGPFAASCLGHTPETVIDEVYKQARTMMHVADMPTIPRAEFVKELASIAPQGMDPVIHSEIGGSAAVELALQIAEYYTPEPQHAIISYYGAYHGRMSGGLSCTPVPTIGKRCPQSRMIL